MKLVFPFLIFVFFVTVNAQETKQEFLEVIVEGKEAYMSTTTGEVVFREHAKTDPTAFITDASGNTVYISTEIHKVKKGEILTTIAKRYGISVAKLKEDNKLKSVNLSIGQALKIKKTRAVESLKPKMTSGEGRIVARLRPGENPAMLYMPNGPPDVPNTPVEPKRETKPKPQVISSEQKQSEAKIVSVAGNDAEKKGVVGIEEESIEAIENRIEDKLEKMDKTLASTVGKKAKKIAKEPTNYIEDSTKDTPADYRIYIVKKGDTLFAIAKANNTTVEAIKTKNKLTSNALSIGQKLKL